MLLRRGGARDQGPELGPHQALLHCPHQRGWSADLEFLDYGNYELRA